MPKMSTVHRGVPNPIVLGRKFCGRCSRWRHVCFFTRNRHRKDGLSSYCEGCEALMRAERWAKISAAALEDKRERDRFWRERQRRRLGIPPATRRRIVLRPERVFLPREPIVRELVKIESRREFAKISGISERTMYRIIVGESEHIRLDLADRIATALGTPLGLLYELHWGAE